MMAMDGFNMDWDFVLVRNGGSCWVDGPCYKLTDPSPRVFSLTA